MKKCSLVVMAAGMASRFGGPKQTMPIDDDGNFIIDYSVYDALKAGFDEVIFIIREETREVFENTIAKRIKDKIKVKYAYQKMEDIPVDFDYGDRVKPWGTVQAVLEAKDLIEGNFVVINADDFYGLDTYKKAYEFLANVKNANHYATISFEAKNTVWGTETVKRGIIKTNKDDITDIMESQVTINGNIAHAEALDGREICDLPSNTSVSMNIFAFQKDVFAIFEEYFKNFFKQNREEILNGEVYLSECLNESIHKNKAKVTNIVSTEKWLGMTYREDLDKVKDEISKLKESGNYPEHLWD